MAKYGIAFRMTAGYVTDATDDTYSLNPTDGIGGEAYPVTRGGITFGVVSRNYSNPCGRDRSTTNSKTAGMMFDSGGGTRDFQIDLTGSQKIRLAIGDPSNSQTTTQVDVRDSGGSKFTVAGGTTSGADKFWDASGAEVSGATIQARTDTQSAAYTFTSYVLLRIASGTFPCIAYVEVEEVGGAAPAARRLTLLGVG
jgi:hypothetical protein